jgi:aspartate/methionine/tyrosine aminotransferase
MRVKIHELFETFLGAHAAEPEVSLVHSLAEPPSLGQFLDALDPGLSLDWSGQSFMGLPSLREEVIERWGYGPVCTADDVLITAGTAEANFLAINNLVGPGDEMIVDVPGWPQPLVLAEALGARVRKLERDEARGWMFDFGQLQELVNANTKLIFICNPNNPTGHVLDRDALQRLVGMADRVGAWVLTDEVYRGMEWGGEDTPRLASLYERGISTGSVSKVLGLQGLRTGWMVCRERRLLTDCMVLREDSSEIMNVMGEAIADIALGADRFATAVDRARRAGQRNLELIHRFIQDRPGLSWVRPRAGLIGFCKIDLGMDAKELSRQLLGPPYRTFVMPGSAYGYPNHVRLGAGGGQEQEVEEGLRRLARFLDNARR